MDLARVIASKTQEVERKKAELARKNEELTTQQKASQILRYGDEQDAMPSCRPGHFGHDVMPEDYLDTVNRLQNHIKRQNIRNQALERECADLKLQIKAKEELVHSTSTQMAKVESITGYKLNPETGEATSPIHRHRGPTAALAGISAPEQKAIIAELETLRDRVKEELSKMRSINQHKQSLIAKMTEREEELAESEEALYAKHNEVSVQDATLQRLAEERSDLRREHAIADGSIGEKERSGDESRSTMDSLLKDKAFLHARISDTDEQIRRQEREIKAQNFTLDVLRKRLDVISCALLDLGLKDEVAREVRGLLVSDQPQVPGDTARRLQSQEKVDVWLYDLISRDAECCQQTINLKDIMLYERGESIAWEKEKSRQIATEGERHRGDMQRWQARCGRKIMDYQMEVGQEEWNMRRAMQERRGKLRKSQKWPAPVGSAQ